MKLDLARLEPAQRGELDAIALELRAPFNDLVQRLGAPHATDIDWWITSVASRNIFSCALFLRCCQLVLARRIAAARDDLREIVVETPALAIALRGALDAAARRVDVRPARGIWPQRLRLYAGACYRWAAAAFHFLNQAFYSRVFSAPQAFAPAAPVVLIDTFLYRDSFEGTFRDRHYPGLLEALTDAERARVALLPSYYRIRNYARFFKALRASPVQMLVKEDYLQPADYAHALAHPWRSLRFAVDRCEFMGADVAPLVNEALLETFAASGTLEGALRHRLARRLADARVPIAHLIDWFENQEIDHGSNAGFRRCLPAVPITGYQGFVVSRHYLCMFPTAEESKAAVIPHRVAVMGPALVEPAKEFCADLPVAVAPAFRFSGLWENRTPRAHAGAFRILVALPLMQHECGAILALLEQALALETAAAGWRVHVKAHPAFAKHLPSRYAAAQGDIDGLLLDADVLVSSASSVCVQALAQGVPVIVVGSASGLTLNPIPPDAPQEMWRLCHAAAELAAALHGFAAHDAERASRYRTHGTALRERYFSPVTPEAVRAFLRLPTATAGPSC